jgi:regulator of sirC expression with transglutaminase-like and TPR domain
MTIGGITSNPDARAWLEAIARLPDERIDLAEAALWIAAEEQPGCDPTATLARLDELGDWLRDRVERVRRDSDRMVTLASFLADEVGLRGNRDDYYEPQNSLLDQVLKRGLGIPITLSLLYIEVGRRVGLPLAGVCYPGHFLVRHAHQPDLVLDPFDSGRLLTRADLQDLLGSFRGSPIPFNEGLLRPAAPREILVRLLNNLHGAYLRRGELVRAISVLDRLLLFDRRNVQALRDRGLLSLRWGDPEVAWQDLGLYLDLVPDAPDREAVVSVLKEARRWGPPIH